MVPDDDPAMRCHVMPCDVVLHCASATGHDVLGHASLLTSMGLLSCNWTCWYASPTYRRAPKLMKDQINARLPGVQGLLLPHNSWADPIANTHNPV